MALFSLSFHKIKDFHGYIEFFTNFLKIFPIGNFKLVTGKFRYFVALGKGPYFGPKLIRKGTMRLFL